MTFSRRHVVRQAQGGWDCPQRGSAHLFRRPDARDVHVCFLLARPQRHAQPHIKGQLVAAAIAPEAQAVVPGQQGARLLPRMRLRPLLRLRLQRRGVRRWYGCIGCGLLRWRCNHRGRCWSRDWGKSGSLGAGQRAAPASYRLDTLACFRGSRRRLGCCRRCGEQHRQRGMRFWGRRWAVLLHRPARRRVVHCRQTGRWL